LSALVIALFGALSSMARPARAAASDLVSLRERAHAQRLWDSRDWQVLLHYRPAILGGWKSEADGLNFFLAGARGRTDPAAELDATLAAFFAPPVSDPQNPEAQHPQCRFPARYAWLKRELGVDPQETRIDIGVAIQARLVDQRCPLLDTWRTGIAAEAVTLVYATAYLNSPASMYGHTFLRLSRATGEGNPLLDYAVNFAADVNTRNGLVYAVRGLTGGFPGRFYVVPYYVKVQEYSNMESRDLWEYELAFTPEQVTRLVLHAWETRTTYFDYFFFTENCSYQLLSLLEVADPSLHLLDQFGGSVVPGDTVRALLEQKGLVRRRATRPSLVSTLRRRRIDLDDREIHAVEAWVSGPAAGAPPAMTGIPPERQARVLDTAADYLRYREGSKGEPGDDFKRRERQMLLARGRLGVAPEPLVVRAGIDAPERGHATLRLGVGGGVSDQGAGFETLSVRGAIHDYLDPARGYPEDAELEMGQLRVRFDNEAHRLGLDRLDLVNILSAAPIDRWLHGVSWRAWFGADNARELGCLRAGSDRAGWRCLYGGATTGGGLSARFGPGQRWLALALADTDLGAGPAFAHGHDYRLGVGGEATLFGDSGPVWRFELGARYIHYLLGETHPALRTRVAQAFSLGRGLALRLAVDTAGTYAQAATELVGYF
jgi:Domain of unknown function (DUF4105)